MGTVTKSIGTAARDYSTLQAWEDALPANLVTDGNAQVGECYNDSVFPDPGASLQLTISGETVDSTNFITLRCATGQSFKDNAGRQTNELRYNQSNGVGIICNNFLGGIVSIPDFTVIDGLQIRLPGRGRGIDVRGNSSIVQNCIVSQEGTTSYALGGIMLGVASGGTNCIARNCLIVTKSPLYGAQINNQGLETYVNCTVVQPSDSVNFGTGNAFNTLGSVGYGGRSKVINCAFFGFATFTDTPTAFTTTTINNCTDLATVDGGGSGNLTTKTYANQFVAVTTATADFRTKTGADLVNNGTTDTTDLPAAVDVVMTTRPQGLAWDIGAWELVPAAAATVLYSLISVM